MTYAMTAAITAIIKATVLPFSILSVLPRLPRNFPKTRFVRKATNALIAEQIQGLIKTEPKFILTSVILIMLYKLMITTTR